MPAVVFWWVSHARKTFQWKVNSIYKNDTRSELNKLIMPAKFSVDGLDRDFLPVMPVLFGREKTYLSYKKKKSILENNLVSKTLNEMELLYKL